MSNLTTMNGGSAVMREGFGERSIAVTRETAQTAAAAQAQAAIQARFIVAMQRPRDWDNVRARLLNECRRPGFARSAFFSVPRGNKPGKITRMQGRIEGLSVRFVEAAIRVMGNIWQSTETIFDDSENRIIRVSLTDLEVNSGFSRDLTISKTVERRELRSGQTVISQRINSTGQTVYLIEATEDEILQREGVIISKTFRTEGIRLVPGDYIEECEEQIIRTVNTEDAVDPDAARKRVADAFASLNILPSMLKEYLGHDLGTCTPGELQGLRGLFTAIQSGDTNWQEVMTEKGVAQQQGDGGGASPPQQQQSQATSRGSRVAERVRGGARKTEKPSEPEPPFGNAQQSQTTASVAAQTQTHVAATPTAQGQTSQPPQQQQTPQSATTTAEGQPRATAHTQGSLLGSNVAPQNGPPSIADERAIRAALQKEALDNFPKEVGIKVRVSLPGGRHFDTETVEMAGMFGDLACVAVKGIDGKMPLDKVVLLHDREPGEDG